jgi:hypothetical protein
VGGRECVRARYREGLAFARNYLTRNIRSGRLTIRSPICLVIALSMGVVLSVSPAAAMGAVPVKRGTYRGETSQNRALVIKMTRSVRRQSFAEADLRTQCGRVGRVTLFAGAFDTRVSRSGRFRSNGIEVETAALNPVLDNGIRRRLFDVTRYEFSGRFVTRRRVRGQWHARSVLFDRGVFTSAEGVFDRCDTGDVTWSARFRRR